MTLSCCPDQAEPENLGTCSKCSCIHSIIHHIFIEVILPASSVHRQMNKTWSLPLRNCELVGEVSPIMQGSKFHEIFTAECGKALYYHILLSIFPMM